MGEDLKKVVKTSWLECFIQKMYEKLRSGNNPRRLVWLDWLDFYLNGGGMQKMWRKFNIKFICFLGVLVLFILVMSSLTNRFCVVILVITFLLTIVLILFLILYLVLFVVNIFALFKHPKENFTSQRVFLHTLNTCRLFLSAFSAKYLFVLYHYFSTTILLFIVMCLILINFFAEHENRNIKILKVILFFVLIAGREFVPSISHLCFLVMLCLIVNNILDLFWDLIIVPYSDDDNTENYVTSIANIFLCFIACLGLGFLIIFPTPTQEITNNTPNQQKETTNNTPNQQKETNGLIKQKKLFFWPKYVFAGLLGAGTIAAGLKKSKQLFVKKPQPKTFAFIPKIISAFFASFKFDL